MARAALGLFVVTAFFAAVDLAHKAAAMSERGEYVLLHERSALYAAVVIAPALVWVVAVVLTRSLLIALTAGVLAGGAAGNLLSLALWPGIPDPIEVERGSWTIAFNLADLFVVSGIVLVVAAAAVFAARNRARLREPVRL